ncbi:exopolygalacturonase [Sphingomonas sp. AP4-R1]|uniref:glycoside hydrolase family 28 protein n=1 Tax=Sphingomonas sp. AP4-R1 TaxID=2735134 RepID=UPI00149371AA|nr:glycosyl hydrolase family 28 protein [Sphingomonas sp. AP4-R1]QJU59099.1 exopolygalacturonase [Sphingomonas sp. AP4-R1]
MTAVPASRFTRRGFAVSALSVIAWPQAARAVAPKSGQVSILRFGARADGRTVNTKAIQAAIDKVAAGGGGTVTVPKGVFVSGALFLKPGVNLHLDKGAVLRCSTDMSHFPVQRTRIEGHFEPRFNPALINAKDCDGLTISGEGTLDGAGRPIWDEFWRRRNAAPDPHNFPNLSVARARLAFIESSRGVTIEGVTFKDSQFWNLHLYRCEEVTVRRARFKVPDDYKQAPSTDGIDLDSCRKVTIEGCFFSVTDDCIAAKGSKGPHALEDRDSPPVEAIRVRDCTFRRGHGVMTLGSEATLVRDVVVENCRVVGPVNVAVLKLRADTPQHYEDIHFRNITLEAEGAAILFVQPWSQYTDLKGAAPPRSVVRNVTLSGIKGRFGAFGVVKPNPGQTEISGIALEDIDVTLDKPQLETAGSPGITFRHVVVNGKPVSA